jgi:hypothetical protein
MKLGRAGIAALLCIVFAACGDDNDGRGSPTPTAIRPTATAAATATEAATLTPVPTATAPPSATPTETAAPDTPTPTATPQPRAVARQITDEGDLIGGPLAVGRVGDFLLANDRIRAVIGAPGRELSFMLTYGGNIIDADVVRPDGEPGRDNFGAMTPLINISSTVNVQQITVVNDGSNGEPAILRTLGVDDLLDAIDSVNAVKGFGVGSIPPSAQDRDLPIEIMSEYTLGVGDTAIRI